MSYLNHSIKEFIEKIDSKSPTPGGGSVSALSALLGIALARMMGQVSIGRKAFRSLPEEHQQEFMQAYEELGLLYDQAFPLIDKDAEAFTAIMDAYKLPKESEEERTKRQDAIQQATTGAIDVPMQVGKLSFQALELLPPMLAYGNKNASSDVKVAALELQTAIKGALLNVEINLTGLLDQDAVRAYQIEVDTLREETKNRIDRLL
jgi:formiminotetrahydrofolate cyclodeaminase